MEESNEVRPLVPVTEEEPLGHIALEKERAAVERRPPRNGYKDVPLTGCHQSVMPVYRLPGSFGDIAAGDERGLVRRSEDREVVQNVLRQPWILGFDRSVVGFEKGDGGIATLEDMANDAKAWSVAFARDVRGVFCQNHDHNCVATCSKYSKSTPDVGGSSNRKKIDPRAYCRFLFVRVVELKVLDKIKKVLRRGKELVEKACVYKTNARNEYGRVQVVRKHPFRSTSTDVGQVFGRCNIDIQRNDRIVPGEISDTCELAPVTFFYGHQKLSAASRYLLASYAEGVRSSHICDFYMTKYLAKGQQVLASAVTPVIQGLQRLEDEVASGTKQLTSLEDAARAKLRRILFSANRSHWFSACELAIFVLTGGHSIATHIDRPMFLSRVFFMLEEGKRLHNGALQGQFLHEAAQALESRSSEVAVVEVVLQPQETEHAAVEDAAPKRQRLEECLSEKSVEEPGNREPSESVASHEGPADDAPQMRMFHATASTYDDWLHRGFFLQDMDFHCYVAHVEVVSRSSGQLGQCFLFDEHYIKSKTYWQRLAQRIAVPRVIGATCPRIDVDEGEENSRYKLALFGLTRCPGRGACADPVALSGSSLAPGADGLARFRTAWKARRAQLEVEARKADAKIGIMKKLPVLCDCTTFRCQEGVKYSADVLLLCQVVYSGFERRHAMGAPYFYSTVACIGAYCDCSPIFAPEQLHLSEFVAHRTRDMVLRLDLHTEARNTAVQVAQKLAAETVEDDAASVGSDQDRILVEVENVGGDGVSEGEEQEAGGEEQTMERGVSLSTHMALNPDAVRGHLLQTSLLTTAADAVKFMLEVETAMSSKFDVCRNSFPITSHENWQPGVSLQEALSQQNRQVELYRQQDTADDTLLSEDAVSAFPSLEASARVVSVEERQRGPAVVAKCLAEEASLNRDQLGFVAMIAVTLQSAWEALPASAHGMLPKNETMFRCLLIGGGGCGKTRIINRVLRPLFSAFFGANAVQTQAPSNKAARQIHGKTMHSANKLRVDSSLRTVHLRLTATTRKSLELSTVPLGAMILDEFSQCIGQMLHADSLRKTYGRQSAYDLELHRYAEPQETWGRMPFVIIAGVSCVFFVSCAVHRDPCFDDFSSFRDCNTLFACRDFQFRSQKLCLIFQWVAELQELVFDRSCDWYR